MCLIMVSEPTIGPDIHDITGTYQADDFLFVNVITDEFLHLAII